MRHARALDWSTSLQKLACLFGQDKTDAPRSCTNARDFIDQSSQGAFIFPTKDQHHQLVRSLPRGLDPVLPQEFLHHQHYNFPETFLAILRQGRVFGQGVVITPKNQVLRDVSIEFQPPWDSHSICRYRHLPRPEFVAGRVAVISSKAEENYFHWLFDVLPRFDLLGKTPVDYYYVSQSQPFQRESLMALGISPNKIIASAPEKHLQARELLVPSLPGDSGQVTPDSCHFIRNLFLSATDASPVTTRKRLFISRKDAHIRQLLNSDEIFSLLEPLGFIEITLTGRTIIDQAALFASAEVIIAPHGAGLSNLVFCQSNTKVIELFSSDYVHYCYWALSHLQNLDYAYLQGEPEGVLETDPLKKNEKNMRIRLQSFKQLLQKLRLK
jgi:capsular polysaccharide biosynthesis protein